MTADLVLDITAPAATHDLGVRLGLAALAGDVVLLEGDLGAGKTTLAQAIGQGLDVPADQYITSPTFAILHEYPGRIPLYHLDLYRLAGEDDLLDLGLEEYLYGAGLCVIEWPDRLGSLRPEDFLEIRIVFAQDGGRQARLTAHGIRWRDWLTEMRQQL